ncbi:phospholipase D-like domain-containing protein [Aurantivibrio plasticivorans]
MTKLQAINEQLHSVLADANLSNPEKSELQALAQQLDNEKLSFLRNRAFDVARTQLLQATRQQSDTDCLATLRWLEQLMKIVTQAQTNGELIRSAHFSPGESCRNKLLDLIHQAQLHIDICVFTISDNILSESIIKAHSRGVNIRILTDNDKSEDMGSDIEELTAAGIKLAKDDSSNHMHHKFAIFDNTWLATGSFNWTRSATKNNEENILVINDSLLIKEYQSEFEKLWDSYFKH